MGLMISLMMLWACSSDDEGAPASAPTSKDERGMSIELSASAVRYREAEGGASRRSWTVPDGYLLYDDLLGTSFVNYHSLSQSTIDLFLTHDPIAEDPTPNPLYARLRYVTSKGNWKLVLPNDVDEDKIDKGDYYAYGFVPRDAATDASLEKLNPGVSPDSYADGAVLTINGLKTVGYDASVIIGARHGFCVEVDETHKTYYDGDYDDVDGDKEYDAGTESRINRLRAGDFKFYLDTGTKTGVGGEKIINPNYLYFLFDHLCSALIINMKVSAEYHALRHIKLKKIYLQTSTDGAVTKKTAKVVVTLAANDTGDNPIQSVTYEPTGDDESGNYVYSSGDGRWLTTDYSGTSLLTHFVPYQVTKLIVTVTYDIYDWNTSAGHPEGNLIRKDCTATNTIPLNLIDRFSVAERGKKYTLNLAVKPTYLYVMSDPDLNNPTMSVE